MYRLILTKPHIECLLKTIDLYIDVGTGKLESIIDIFDKQVCVDKDIKEIRYIMFGGKVINDTSKISIARFLKNHIQENLEISEEHAKLLINILDFYSRIAIGQFEEIFYGRKIFSWNFSVLHTRREKVQRILNAIKHKLSIGSFGIYSKEVSEEAKIAYDIQQVIRYCIAWDNNPRGGITVDFDEPIQSSTVSFPKIERI